MKSKLSFLLVAAMMLGILAPGCSKEPISGDAGTDAASPKIAKETIVIVTESEPETLDPVSANTDAIALTLGMIGDHLFDLNADGSITPGGIVESWEQIDDLTVKFTIKGGLKFSDGSDLTTEDIVWELGRLKEAPRSASNFAFVNIDETEIVDETTFVLKLNQAWSPFQNTLSTGRGTIVSKDSFESMGEADFGRAPVTSGPYKIEEWVPGTSITLVRNEYYWGEPAKTAKIVIKFIPEATSRVIELETGSADIAYYIEGNDAGRVDSLEGYHVEMGDAYRNVILTFSMQDEILKNEKIRHALCYAIDLESLVPAASDNLGTLNTGLVSIPTLGYKEMPPWPYDIERAKELIAEAGYPNGFAIDLHYDGTALYGRIASIIQNMWSHIGVTANIVSSALATYDAQNNGHFQACIRDITASEISNELIIYESAFGSRLQGNDPELDEMLLELRTYYYDDPEREVFIDGVFEYLYNKKYSESIMNMPIVYAVRDDLEGFEFHPAIDHMKHITDWVVYE